MREEREQCVDFVHHDSIPIIIDAKLFKNQFTQRAKEGELECALDSYFVF